MQPSLYIEPISRCREVMKIRENLQSQTQLIQSLAKLLKLIEKAKTVADLTGVSNAHAKYAKNLQKRQETVAKLSAKALKE